MLLTPFVLASFGSLLTDSVVYAAEWTDWQNCQFGGGTDYTRWRALIDVRSSDNAARAIKVQYGYGTNERMSRIRIQESRIIDGGTQWLTPSVLIELNNQSTWISPLLSSLPWVSNAFRPRYINVMIVRSDGISEEKFCTSKIAF